MVWVTPGGLFHIHSRTVSHFGEKNKILKVNKRGHFQQSLYPGREAQNRYFLISGSQENTDFAAGHSRPRLLCGNFRCLCYWPLRNVQRSARVFRPSVLGSTFRSARTVKQKLCVTFATMVTLPLPSQISLCSCLIRTLEIAFRAHQDNLKILNSITSAKSLLP